MPRILQLNWFTLPAASTVEIHDTGPVWLAFEPCAVCVSVCSVSLITSEPFGLL